MEKKPAPHIRHSDVVGGDGADDQHRAYDNQSRDLLLLSLGKPDDVYQADVSQTPLHAAQVGEVHSGLLR